MPRVLDDPHYRSPGQVPSASERDALSDGISPWVVEVARRERLVDDDDPRRPGGVTFVERASLEEALPDG